MICGVEITMDEVGRYNLNALHKAAMAEGDATENQRPSQFIRNRQIQRFVETLSRVQKCTLEQNQPLKVINGGGNQGVWAVELLAIRYAAWIKPEFEIEVYQTFRDYRTGKLTTPHTTKSAGINEVLLQELLLQMRENQEYQRREILSLRSELEQLKAQPANTAPQQLLQPQPTSSAGELALERERDQLAAMLGRSKDYATISAVERVIEREFSWHPLRKWCLIHHEEPVYLKKYGCAWPRGAWLAVYRVDLESCLADHT
ncbi:KilA-N domain-containing protein [Citrobacter freundii]|nr:KilA-N domain-containing protein [Citrobacter freundii]